MDLKQAIKYALNGDAVLFCGSGFSIFAENQHNEKLKTTKGLCEKMIEKGELDFENEGDIEFLSQEFINSKGEDELIELLQKEYIISSYEDLYNEIAQINWRRIYTTNYDNILEKASDEVGITRVPVTLEDAPSKKSNQKKIIHLNGYIKRLDKNKLNNEFKLTENSYLTKNFLNKEWSEIFRNDIRNAKAVIFIGYSMKYDLDIKRTVMNNNDNNEKIHFINGNELSKREKVLFDRYGNNSNLGIKDFVSKIKNIKKDFTPIERVKGSYNNFKYYNNEENQLKRITDKHILDLFMYGRIEMDHVRNSTFERKYLLKREKVSTILKEVENNPQAIVVTSDMANGKTCFIKSLIQELINNDYNVFKMNSIEDDLIDEFEHISKNYNNKCIIIDNYHLYLDKIKKFKNYVDNDITYIITARTLLNDIYFHRLGKVFSCKDEEILHFNINRLSNNEIHNLVKIFEEYNLWGEYSSKTFNEKKKLLKQKFKRKFQNILIGVLESEYIEEKVDEILNNINNNKYIKKIMLASFINYIIGINLRVDELIALLKDCKINASVKNNPAFRELVDIEENEFKIKSSLLANYIINEKRLKKDAIEVLIEMASKADNYYKSNSKYKKFLKIILSFSNIQFLLKSNNDRKYANNIINYYDRIKNLQFNKRNPYFWFQYAIARLELKQYPEAKKYFDSAYSYAKEKSNFDTIQLDTHYARYLLENQIENGSSKDPFEVFSEAHNYISRDRRNKNHYHYPLRQSIYYYKYYQKFYNEFSDGEKTKFMLMCTEILKKINSYKKAIGNKRSPHPEVTRSEENIRKLLAEIRIKNSEKPTLGYVKKRGMKKHFGYINANMKDVHFWKSECNFDVRPYDLVEFDFVDNDKGGTAKNIKKLDYISF